MTTATRMLRRPAGVVVAVVVCLALVGAGGQATGVAGPHSSADPRPVQLPPDRADGLGTVHLVTVPPPLVLIRATPDRRFDWAAAAIGAAFMLACGLAGTAAVLVRGRTVAGRR